MPAWRYDTSYDTHLIPTAEQLLIGVDHLLSVNDHEIAPLATDIIEGLAACSRYRLSLSIGVDYSAATIVVEVGLVGGNGFAFLSAGELEILESGPGFPDTRFREFAFSGELATPDTPDWYWLAVRRSGDTTLWLKQPAAAPVPVDIDYLGSSVQCGDIIIPPPPPLGAWCEPFPPSDADTADQLYTAHLDRMDALSTQF